MIPVEATQTLHSSLFFNQVGLSHSALKKTECIRMIKGAMSSYMLRRFTGYGMLCRIGGCFFIQNFGKKSLERARVTWKTPYTFYSILCFCFFLWFEAAFIVRKSFILTSFSSSFTRSLLFILHSVVTCKIFVNFTAMVMGSAKLLDFFRKSGAFENSTVFALPRRHRWPVLRRFLVLVALLISYAVGIHLFIGEVADELPHQWALAAKVCGYIAGIGFFLYDSLPFVVMRCCTEVLVDYTHAQLLSFMDCDRSNVARTDLDACRQIETIRINLSNIRELKDILNGIWKWPLAAMSASLLFILCIVLYTVFDGGVYRKDIWIILTYSVYSTLCFVEIAFVSQALMDETQRLREATRAVRTTEATEAYVQQLRYLHDVIDPVGMCLTGGSFFCLKKSLLVSMAGAIITYTVILVQTSDQLSEKLDGALPTKLKKWLNVSSKNRTSDHG